LVRNTFIWCCFLLQLSANKFPLFFELLCRCTYWSKVYTVDDVFTYYAGAVRREIAEETDRVTGRSRQISPVPIHLSVYSPNGELNFLQSGGGLCLRSSFSFTYGWTWPYTLLSAGFGCSC
jgi:hypothetical protein